MKDLYVVLAVTLLTIARAIDSAPPSADDFTRWAVFTLGGVCWQGAIIATVKWWDYDRGVVQRKDASL